MSWDPDLDLEHGVLTNLLGITDRSELASVEARVTAVRIAELMADPPRGRFDLAYLQAVHFKIFADLYPFAGQVRRVRLGKAGTVFCLPEQIPAYAAAVFDQRSDPDRWSGLDRDRALDALTDLMADLVFLHPFREGNGRAIRAYLQLLVAAGGWRLTWTGLGRDDNARAGQEACAGDVTLLRRILDRHLGP
ncbi:MULTISPECIES: Fic family protein [unclassified Pseudonocardia]|uniref:Fic/DOC family protein n=1 Tax=unclassified Pseudonocardia TaxID=2619320 RepID=UPI0001FFEEA4|nr:Fic family protein [Pseudonocardia sp. Ae707_Ps1]OLM09236.1 Cell filamentation protein fic [Pseudonocardia sp. Ae707_Ps1]